MITLEGRSAIQSNLDRQEKWTVRNFLEFNKGKLRVWHRGQNSHMQLQGVNQWLESSFAEKGLGFPVHVLNKSKQCGLCLLYAGLN